MNDQQFGNSRDGDVPPATSTPPWIVTPPSDPPPWLVSQPPPDPPPWLISQPPHYDRPPPSDQPPHYDQPPPSDPPPWLISQPSPSDPPSASAPPWPQLSAAPRPAEMSSVEAPPWAPPPAEPPAWIVSEPAEPAEPTGSPSSPGRNRRPLVVAAAVLAVLIVAGGGWFVVQRHKAPEVAPITAPTTAVPAPTAVPATTVPTEDPTTTYPTEAPATTEITTAADPQQEALRTLDQISAHDLGEVTFDGRYVAQVASKNPGTYDRFQTTASGSHTFQATDVLAEYQRLRDDLGATRVVLLKSTDFGRHQLYHNQPLYVTFYLGHFGSADAVQSWCASTFPDLSAAALADQCAVRKMH